MIKDDGTVIHFNNPKGRSPFVLMLDMQGPVWVKFQQGYKTDKSNDYEQPRDEL